VIGPVTLDGHRRRPESGADHAQRSLDGHVARCRGGQDGAMTERLPIGVTIRTIRAEPAWWLESARRLDDAGYAGVWAWDHFMGRGDVSVPVVEGPTILAMVAGATRRVMVGTFVVNVMNRHPAVLARMASTLQIASGGRFILGLGIGGHPKEHAAYGMEFPDAKERATRLEEAIAVVRALWTGGPVTPPSPYYPLADAAAFPIPTPTPPIIIGGETAAGARLAGRIGDGWSAFDDNFEQNLPLYLESLAAAGRHRAEQQVQVGFQGDWLGDADLAESEWIREPRAAWDRWHEKGADGAIVLARTTADVDALVEAVARW
jgi:alkanesulfonate monooxygenase SsuD/methylene tetrahydromethanopterin reductase-like flavin-dependent oxidoreductase (luciferase family)